MTTEFRRIAQVFNCRSHSVGKQSRLFLASFPTVSRHLRAVMFDTKPTQYFWLSAETITAIELNQCIG